MRIEERERLEKAANENKYLSIAINQDETPVCGGFVPWQNTTSAFNMKIPDVTLAKADLQDPVIIQLLRQCKLIGCYIYVPLADYSFLSTFSELRDLFIQHGQNMRDLSFVRHLPYLFMFYLEDAVLPDLNPLIDNCNEGKRLPGKCFGFYHCKVLDTSALLNVRFIFSELLIWPVAKDCKENWKTSGHPSVFRFYSK